MLSFKSASSHLAKKIIQMSNLIPIFKGDRNPIYSQEISSFEMTGANHELKYRDDFIEYFGKNTDQFVNSIICDHGSGYGGKTLHYAGAFNPKLIIGVEPYENMVSASNLLKTKSSVLNCDFRLCDHLNIPLENNCVDFVFSFDVLEHVEDPVKTLDEFYRILKPGGKVFIIFTPYFGAFSHHLNYISKFPFLHWLFSSTSLVEAVNSILAGSNGEIFNTSLQPNPKLSYNNKRYVLPTLNGLTSKEFYNLVLASGFDIEEFRQISLFGKFLSRFGMKASFNLPLHKTPFWKVQEGWSFNLVAVLRKS